MSNNFGFGGTNGSVIFENTKNNLKLNLTIKEIFWDSFFFQREKNWQLT